MKKKCAIIALIILLVIIIGVSVLVLSLNKEKDPITANEFKSTMESKGYAVEDVTNQFAEYGNYITKGYISGNSDFQIEFYSLSNIENAIDMYSANQAKFEAVANNASASYTVSMSNYSIYSITANGKYKYLSRIDNTLVYLDVDIQYQDIVKDIVKELGY